MISKKQFVGTINFLKKSNDRVLEISDLLDSNFVFNITCEYEDTILKYLSDAMNDVEYISWWIYDCEYGQKHTEIWSTDINGKETVENIDTVEKLYDFLWLLGWEK